MQSTSKSNMEMWNQIHTKTHTLKIKINYHGIQRKKYIGLENFCHML